MTKTRKRQARGVRHRTNGHPEKVQSDRYDAALPIPQTETADPAALYSLGVRAAERADYQLAAALISRAIRYGGPGARHCRTLAEVFTAQGLNGQAALCYRQAIVDQPADITLYLGLARALINDSRPAEGAGVLAQALALQPEAAEGWALLGAAFNLSGRLRDAVDALRHAIKLQPSEARFHFDLGVTSAQLGHTNEAEEAYRKALQQRTHFPEALNNLGNLLRRRGADEEAAACYRNALVQRPDYCDARYNLGLALQTLDLPEKAESCYRAVVRQLPDHHAAKNNLANTLLETGKPGEALDYYEEALRVKPDNPEYRANLGMAQLLSGNFAEGWRNYGARSVAPRNAAPLWKGEPLQGRTILLCSEQGFGDTIQFVRYTRLLSELDVRVLVSCPQSLTRLLNTMPDIAGLAAITGALPASDYQVPLLHLPAILGTRLETIPAHIPYLFADPDLVRDWALKLDIPKSHLKVGIAWRGSPAHRNDRKRSIEPAELSALAGVPGTSFISLQQGLSDGVGGALPFVPLGRELTDFADTAALMSNLDIVISVDTAVTHLAGALAVPVWTLLAYNPDWRWMLGRDDSPWYPGMRLFRQERRGDWGSVMRRVREELWDRRSCRLPSCSAGQTQTSTLCLK
jgi:tetratricopeptide (TPR) repeat protein